MSKRLLTSSSSAAASLALCAAFIFSACGKKQIPQTIDGTPEKSPPRAALVTTPLQKQTAENPSSKTLFVALSPEDTGIAPTYKRDPGHPFAYLYGSGMEASGVAVGDVDGDGLPDIFLASSPGDNRLYRQVSPLKFEDITVASGLHRDTAWSRGASFVDIDNDGDLDLYIANYSEENLLFINGGTKPGGGIVFEDRAREFGIDLLDACLMPAFCDYDGDGDLDLYVLSNLYHLPDKSFVPNTNEMVGNEDGKPIIKAPYDNFFRITEYRKAPSGEGFQVKWDRTGRPNHLYRNNGDGTFSDVTVAVGMQPGHGRGLSANWWDYNDDGHPDLYIANDWGDRDFLYHNNGDGTFRDAIEEAVPYTSMFTMGSDAGDLNNDGRIDFIAADMSGTTHYKRKVSMGSMQADKIEFMAAARPQQNMRNVAYLNTGTDHLLEAAYLMGLANSDWSWAVKIADLDNDGLNDVFITNGMEKNLREVEGTTGGVEGNELRKENNLAFRNLGDLHFSDHGKDWGIDHFGYSTAAANCDFDRDGDIDLFVMHRDEAPILYKNTSANKGILVKLYGRSSNRNGIGAKILAETKSGTQVRQIMCTRGYLASDEAIAHFGLGDAEGIEKLTVEWPGGHRQEFTDLAGGNLYEITEPEGKPAAAPLPESKPIFAAESSLSKIVHRETPFDDFAVQPLLPNKLSQLGPGIAVGDIDGDGDEDFVLGGATGSPTQVVTNAGGGKYDNPRPLAGSDAFEDMGILLFDADADGDQDLFVASGGVESAGTGLGDRLYLNDGRGNFAPAPSQNMPAGADNSGPVACADFDRDGDLDLFVGGGSIPGQYPLAAKSRLLVNDGGTFSEAPLIEDLGIVRGATFADVDGDGWQDLLLAREWGSVAYLRNDNGTFKDAGADAGIADLRGWWNGVAAGDLDGDGDLDFVATNFGHNTKYHASPEKPALLYYGKFGTDTMRLVEAEYEGDHLLPVRGKSCSTRAIPHLGEKFKTFHSFALADVTEIYTQPELDDSTKFSATTLDSGVFINDGNGHFEFSPLPELAQLAPALGIVIGELDGDGISDLMLAQNFYSPQVETGRMSGGLGVMLRGVGDGNFTSVWPRDSGILIPEDATGAVLTDADGDGRPDLLVASNDGQVRHFSNTAQGGKFTRVSLRGTAGNPDAIGARITATLASGGQQSGEITAGHGYLGQSAPALFFGAEITEFTIRWPDGTTTREQAPVGKTPVTFRQR